MTFSAELARSDNRKRGQLFTFPQLASLFIPITGPADLMIRGLAKHAVDCFNLVPHNTCEKGTRICLTH